MDYINCEKKSAYSKYDIRRNETGHKHLDESYNYELKGGNEK
ncbi:MAG: hypothetical protein AABY02_03270 [Nanoarchaeota archaeon]